MVKFWFNILLVFNFTFIYSQSNKVDEKIIEVGFITPEYRSVYQIGDQQGDIITLYHTLSEYLEVPVGYCDSIPKHVIVEFYADKNCEIIDVKVVMGLNEKIDKEVVRVISLLKCIKPAYIRGKPIKYKETISFIICKERVKPPDKRCIVR